MDLVIKTRASPKTLNKMIIYDSYGIAFTERIILSYTSNYEFTTTAINLVTNYEFDV